MTSRFKRASATMAVSVIVLGAFATLSAPAAADPEGATTLVCPRGSYVAPGFRELGSYEPFRATDGTVLAPKAYDEATVVYRTEGQPMEIGTLSPSALGGTDHNTRATVQCSFSWTRDYVLDGRSHSDSYYGLVTVVIGRRAS